MRDRPRTDSSGVCPRGKPARLPEKAQNTQHQKSKDYYRPRHAPRTHSRVKPAARCLRTLASPSRLSLVSPASDHITL